MDLAHRIGALYRPDDEGLRTVLPDCGGERDRRRALDAADPARAVERLTPVRRVTPGPAAHLAHAAGSAAPIPRGRRPDHDHATAERSWPSVHPDTRCRGVPPGA